jgi:hypothetical protein
MESMTRKELLRDTYVLGCEVQRLVRGRRKKYARRAWKIVHHLPHWDGPLKALGLLMLVLLVHSAVTAKLGGGKGSAAQ